MTVVALSGGVGGAKLALGLSRVLPTAELLVVFIGLEISSISTYILCGFRKGSAAAAESEGKTPQ